MSWNILNDLVKKLASEVHKSKIDEFEKRILLIEQKQEVILKTIENNKTQIEKLDDRVYQANLDAAKAIGTINTIKTLSNQVKGGNDE